jgi:hypothetical protein
MKHFLDNNIILSISNSGSNSENVCDVKYFSINPVSNYQYFIIPIDFENKDIKLVFRTNDFYLKGFTIVTDDIESRPPLNLYYHFSDSNITELSGYTSRSFGFLAWTGVEKYKSLAPTEVRTPNRLPCSGSLFRILYPPPRIKKLLTITFFCHSAIFSSLGIKIRLISLLSKVQAECYLFIREIRTITCSSLLKKCRPLATFTYINSAKTAVMQGENPRNNFIIALKYCTKVIACVKLHFHDMCTNEGLIGMYFPLFNLSSYPPRNIFQEHSQNSEKRILTSSCLSVCPSVWNFSAPSGPIFMKFYI